MPFTNEHLSTTNQRKSNHYYFTLYYFSMLNVLSYLNLLLHKLINIYYQKKSIILENLSQRAWKSWHMPLISSLGRQRQADLYVFEPSVIFRESPSTDSKAAQRKPFSKKTWTKKKEKSEMKVRHSNKCPLMCPLDLLPGVFKGLWVSCDCEA